MYSDTLSPRDGSLRDFNEIVKAKQKSTIHETVLGIFRMFNNESINTIVIFCRGATELQMKRRKPRVITYI